MRTTVTRLSDTHGECLDPSAVDTNLKLDPRPSLLTVLIDDRIDVAKFPKSKVVDKVPEGSAFMELPKFPYNTE